LVRFYAVADSTDLVKIEEPYHGPLVHMYANRN